MRNAYGCLMCVFALSCASAQAANLLQNPDFIAARTDWTTYSTPFAIDHADGSPAAPALQLSTNNGVLYTTQCVSLTGSPQPWDFGIRLRVLNSTGSSCQTYIYTSFDTGTCTSRRVNVGVGASAVGTVAGLNGDFVQYAATTKDPTVGAHSAEFVIQVNCIDSADSMTINVDHAYLGTSGSTPVRLQSFDVR